METPDDVRVFSRGADQKENDVHEYESGQAVGHHEQSGPMVDRGEPQEHHGEPQKDRGESQVILDA